MVIRNLESIYWSKWLLKFISIYYFKGKRFLIERCLYFGLFLVKKKLDKNPLFYFFEVLEKIKPVMGLKVYKVPKRKLYKIKTIPFIIKFSTQYKKAITWLVKSIKLLKGINLSFKIFQEFYSIIYKSNSGTLHKKKEYYKYILMFKVTKKFKW